MTVYSWRILDSLINGVRSTASRLLDNYNVKISGDEFVQTYIKPEHVEPLRTTQKIVGLVGSTSVLTSFTLNDGKTTSIYITFAGGKPPIIIPNYVTEGPTEHAPAEVMARISEYAEERVRLGRLFGDAIDALHYLNDACGNANAMGVMFPALPTLFSSVASNDDDPNAKRGRRIADAKSFGKLPKLPRSVTNRILECSNLVLNTMMLEPLHAEDGKQLKHEATLRVSAMETHHSNFIYDAIGQVRQASFV